MALNENPMFSPMMILERMFLSLEQLKKVMVEIGEEKTLDQEIMKNKTLKMNKKYIQLTNLLEDETRQNKSLRGEVEMLKQANTGLRMSKVQLEEDTKILVKENARLQNWKDVECRKIKDWAKTRIKAGLKRIKNPQKIRVGGIPPHPMPQFPSGRKK